MIVRNSGYGLRGVRVGEASNPSPPKRRITQADVSEDEMPLSALGVSESVLSRNSNTVGQWSRFLFDPSVRVDTNDGQHRRLFAN